jgi:hypothetical protein
MRYDHHDPFELFDLEDIDTRIERMSDHLADLRSCMYVFEPDDAGYREYLNDIGAVADWVNTPDE